MKDHPWTPRSFSPTSTWPEDCVRAGKLLSSSFVAVELNLFENPRSFDRTSWFIYGYHGIPWYFSLEKWLVNADHHGWWYDDPQNRRKTLVQPLNHQTSASAFEVTSALETPLCVVAPSITLNNITRVTRASLLNVNDVTCFDIHGYTVYSVLNKTVRPLLTFKFISSAFSVRLPDPPSVMFLVLGFVGLGHGGRSTFAPKQTCSWRSIKVALDKLVRVKIGHPNMGWLNDGG